jgi:hypothetical protein
LKSQLSKKAEDRIYRLYWKAVNEELKECNNLSISIPYLGKFFRHYNEYNKHKEDKAEL